MSFFSIFCVAKSKLIYKSLFTLLVFPFSIGQETPKQF